MRDAITLESDVVHPWSNNLKVCCLPVRKAVDQEEVKTLLVVAWRLPRMWLLDAPEVRPATSAKHGPTVH